MEKAENQTAIGALNRIMELDLAGEMVALLETEKHDIGDILRESLEQEKTAMAAYYDLLQLSEGQSVLLDEYAREMIVQEELHLDEVNKMLRKPGATEPFQE